MSTMIKRQLWILYLIIIMYNIVAVNCEISNDDDLNMVSDGSDIYLRMQDLQYTVDGSGDTSKINFFIIKNLI